MLWFTLLLIAITTCASENFEEGLSNEEKSKSAFRPASKTFVSQSGCNVAVPSETFYEDAKKGEIFMILSEDETVLDDQLES